MVSLYRCVYVKLYPSFLSSGEICRKHKVFLHTDAAQAVGKVRVDVNDMNIDLMSISGHKIYGPKGAQLAHSVFECVCGVCCGWVHVLILLLC